MTSEIIAADSSLCAYRRSRADDDYFLCRRRLRIVRRFFDPETPASYKSPRMTQAVVVVEVEVEAGDGVDVEVEVEPMGSG